MKTTEPRWREVAIIWTLFAVVALLVSFPRRLRKSRVVIGKRVAMS